MDVVVVTYNSAAVVTDLLDSLPAAFGGAPRRVVVVDNDSTDDTREIVAARDDCLLVHAPNHGYGAGANTGVRALAGTGPILLLNPDVRLHPGAVEALHEALGPPGTGIAVPRLLDPDGSTARSLRREPTVARSLGFGDSRVPVLSEIVNEPAAYERPHRVDWATGAVALIDRRCYDAVGGFDELFFMYSEETDFSLRAADAGFATTYTPEARAEHVGGASGRNPDLYALQVLNRIRLYRRRHRLLSSAVLLALVLAREAVFAARGDADSRRAVAALLRPSATPRLALWRGSPLRRSRPQAVERGTDTDRETLLFLSGVAWDAVKGTDRHLAEQLGRSVDVVWVEPPVSVLKVAAERDLARLRRVLTATQVAPGVTRVTLLTTPFPSRRGWSAVAGQVPARALRRWLAARGVERPLMVNTSPHTSFEVAGPSGRRLYYATDDFVAGAELLGLSTSTLLRAERRRIEEADLLATVAPGGLSRHDLGGREVLVLPNGCDVDAYADVDEAPCPDDVALRSPVAGVVGQISARTDLALLEAVADTGMSLLLVGPVQDGFEPERFGRLVACDNVVWVGRKPFEELPSYLRLVDVGLTAYAPTDFNRASFPLKTLEYLAAGRGAVSTPLPAVELLGTDLVTTAATAEEFAAAVQEVAAVPRTPELHARRRALAARYSWQARARELLALLRAD